MEEVRVRESEKEARFLDFSLKRQLDSLPAEVFAVESRLSYESLLHHALRSELAANRLATHKVKHRGEVSGTGKKPWQQKKLGRARAGSKRSPIFTGGGVVFGPSVERNYKIPINKKQYFKAFTYLLSRLVDEERLLSLELNLPDFRCKNLLKRLRELELPRLKTLIVSDDQLVQLASANIPWITSLSARKLRISDLLNSRLVILDPASLDIIKERFSFERSQIRDAKKRKISLEVVENSQEGR